MSLTKEDKDYLTILRAYAQDVKSPSVNVRYYSTASWAGVRIPEIDTNTIYIDGTRGMRFTNIPWVFYRHLKATQYATDNNPNCYLIGTLTDLADIVDEIFRLDTVNKLRALID
ncbi:MAG: hypothetical protein EOO61_01300 [Hymenobacter sp.]|nr:MAG: hypothetical protein EOO61_01300 [Hymenobacter sp.]